MKNLSSRLSLIVALIASAALLAGPSVYPCPCDGQAWTPPSAGVSIAVDGGPIAPSNAVCCGRTVHFGAYEPSDADKDCAGNVVPDRNWLDPPHWGFTYRWETAGQLPVEGPVADFMWTIPGVKTVTLWVTDPGEVYPDGGEPYEYEITVVEVASVTPPAHDLCPAEAGQFTATTYPAGHANLLTWTGGEDPPTSTGAPDFWSSWSTPGTKTVTASCGCYSQSASIDVFEPIHEITFLGQEETGGEIVIRMKVRNRCAYVGAFEYYIKENTAVHVTDPVWQPTSLSRPEEEESYTYDPNTKIEETIYKLYYNTLYLHNGSHTFQLHAWALESQDYAHPENAIYHEENFALTILNLAVQSVSPVDYVVWLGGPEPLVINVEIADNDTSDPMDISLTIWPTEEETAVRTITLSGVTGSSHTFEWDGTDEYGQLVPWGPYTYDVVVEQEADSDSAHYRSDYLDAISHAGRWRTAPTGELVVEDGNLIREFSYELTDDPAQVIVEHLDGGFAVEDSAELTDQIRTWENPVVLHSSISGDPSPEQLSGRDILRATDSRGAQYRDHQNRRMLVWNAYWSVTTHRAVLQFSLIGGPGGHLRERTSAKSGSLANWTAWSDSHSWEADSGNNLHEAGNPDCMNMRNREWVSDNNPCDEQQGYAQGCGCSSKTGKCAKSAGPIPHVSDITVAPYRCSLTKIPTTEDGMVVTASDGRTEGWKYFIYDRTGTEETIRNNDTHSPENGWIRMALRVHPDQGAHGTRGCIGIGGDHVESARYDACVAVRTELERLDNMDNLYLYPGQYPFEETTRIPLFVTETVSQVGYTSYVYWHTE